MFFCFHDLIGLYYVRMSTNDNIDPTIKEYLCPVLLICPLNVSVFSSPVRSYYNYIRKVTRFSYISTDLCLPGTEKHRSVLI